MEIKINNNTYKIFEVEPNDERLKMEDEDYHSGVTDFYKKEIYINNSLNTDSKRYTIIHELTHALIDSFGFMQVDWNDEIIADFVANYLPNLLEILNKMQENEKNSQIIYKNINNLNNGGK